MNTSVKNTKTEITQMIIDYFRANEDVLNSCIEELDSYNGYLNDSCYYDMGMLQDFYSGTDPVELLQRAFFGWDEDSWEINEYGEKVHRVSFNPNRKYFSYNGCGNLVSTDYKDYSAFLDKYLIEALSENRNEIYSIEDNIELTDLFNEYEETL